SGTATRPRSSIAAWLERDDVPLNQIDPIFAAEVLPKIKSTDRSEYLAHFNELRPYLHPNENGKLALDEEAKSLGLHYDDSKFLAGATRAMENDSTAAPARAVLRRYIPDGPGGAATPADWKAWIAKNRPYLFFSEVGGCRWYVDPLALARGAPTKSL